MTMAFAGDMDFKEGRSPSQTTTLILQQCLGKSKKSKGNELEDFFEGLAISSRAFAKDIDADWITKPFIGQHAFKIVLAAGYEGTENDFWLAITGRDAPYFIKKPAKKPSPRKSKTVA
jgi:hypothetical protein